MRITETAKELDLRDLTTMAAHSAQETHGEIFLSGDVFPFSDYTRFLSELFKWQDHVNAMIIAAGPVRPEVEIAADRA